MIPQRRRFSIAVKILDFAFEDFGDQREPFGAGIIAGLLHFQDGSRRDADGPRKFVWADAAFLAQRFDAFRGVTSLTLCFPCGKLLLVTVGRLFAEPSAVTCGIIINPC